jgi:hypothetical protein
VRKNTGYKGEGYGTDVIDSDWFVRYAVFTPDDPSLDLSSLTWKLADGMVSYAGAALDGETAALHILRLEPGDGLLNTRTVVTDENGRVTRLPEPVLDGFRFQGWFTSPEGGRLMTAGDAFTDDLILYARWEEVPEETEPDDEEPEEEDPDDEDYDEDLWDEETDVTEPDAGDEGTELAVNPFEDVPEDSYYYEAVLWAAAEGITTGTTKTTFSPKDTVTRAQTVTFLWRAAGKPEPAAEACPFADVPDGAYYRSAVLWAVAEGITLGTGDGKFSPNDDCVRAQIVTFLYRACGRE